MNIWDKLPEPFFVLAPMDDVTDTVFRQIIASTAAPDLFFTEFVNVEALQSAGRPKTLPKLVFTDIERPLIAQVWGKNPESFYDVARQIADGSLPKELGLPEGINFAGIDLNMGCPAKSEVQNGTCSALILPENRGRAVAMIQACKEGAPSLPVSVKTRLGYSTVDLTWHELLLQQNLSALTIHGRTKSQMSKVPADWNKIGEIRELRDKLSPTTKIIGNGDVATHDHGLKLAAQYSLDGIMIGRGVFDDPFVFAKDSPWADYTPEQKTDLYRQHVELFEKTWQNNERKVITLNKFCKIYIQGFDGAVKLREKLMSADSTDKLLYFLAEL